MVTGDTEMTVGGWQRVTRSLNPRADDPWFDYPVWGCDKGHVSTILLKSEALGRSACLACLGEVFLIERIEP